MNVPNVKGLLQKLSFLRNNLALLVPIIIAGVALVLLIPTRMINARLRSQIEAESVRKGNRVSDLMRDVTPSDAIRQEQEYQKAYENDANQIERLAKETAQRELLSYKILPKPKDTSPLIFEEFGQRYRAGLEGLIAGAGAGDCPTDSELETALQSAATRSRFGRGGYSPYGSMAPGPARRPGRGISLAYGVMGEVEKKIVDEICREKAKTAPVYAIVDDLAGYEFWAGYKSDTGLEQAIKDCWYWQLSYWITEDVFNTIRSMNAGSNSIMTSPVKRLLGVNFDLSRKGAPRMRRPGRLAKGKKEGGAPSYVTNARDVLTMPCTGRFSKAESAIDVVHFNVVVVVSADAVLPFMKELCKAKEHRYKGYLRPEPEQTLKHNQITVLESNIGAVDREDRAHSLYRYGENPVVELDLICEYIFNKTGYDEIKPEEVKTDLAAQAEAQKGVRR